MGGRMYLGDEMVTPVIVDMSGSSGDDWGQSLQGDIEVDNTFICAPYKCYGNQNITSFSAPNVTDVSMPFCFGYCTLLTTVSTFDGLTSVGTRALQACFTGCTSLTTAPTFANLKSIGHFGLGSCFSSCASLTSVSFPSLTTIGESGLSSCFTVCTSLQSISFPSLTTQSFGSYTNQFGNMLSSTGTSVTHTIHFPSNLESTIQGLSGYPNFGGTSGYVTLAFDLPSTS